MARVAQDTDISKRYFEGQPVLARYYSNDLVWEALETPSPDLTQFYVSATGNDSNDGSEASPWATVTKVNGVAFPSGSTVNFEGGSTFTGTLLLQRDGVTYKSYGTGKATISSGNEHGIRSVNTGNITLESLIVQGSGKDVNTGTGINFKNDQAGNTKIPNITIRDVEIFGYKHRGIEIEGANISSGFDNVLIEDCLVYEIGREGIVSMGVWDYQKTTYAHSNFTVRGCEVHHVYGLQERTDTHTGSPIMLSDIQGGVIENCVAHNSAMLCNGSGGGAVGIWFWDSDDVVIRDCEAYRISSGLKNKDGAGFDLDGGVTNGIMERNYSHDNDGGGFIIGQFDWARPMANIIIRHNLSVDDARKYSSSLYIFSGETNISGNNYIVNNSFLQGNRQVSTFSTTVWNGGNVGVWTVKNNIFDGASSAFPANWTKGFNNIYPVDVNPGFINGNPLNKPYNFDLILSPYNEMTWLLDMGDNLGSEILGDTDFEGNPIGESVDIGHKQYTTVSNAEGLLRKRASAAGTLNYGWKPVPSATNYIVTVGGWDASWNVLPEVTFETTQTEHTVANPVAGGRYLINLKTVTPKGTSAGRDLYTTVGVDVAPDLQITSYTATSFTIAWSGGGGTGTKSLIMSKNGVNTTIHTTALNSGTFTYSTGLAQGDTIGLYFTVPTSAGVTLYGIGDGVTLFAPSWRVPLT